MWFRLLRYRDPNIAVMSLEESRRTQKPYRYGMILLCVGALINWLGIAEHYAEPIKYVGVACIIAGALLICTAMCCWLHAPNRTGTSNNEETDDPIHIISSGSDIRCEKPPDYETVATELPSYDDAIKLNPSVLLAISCANDNVPCTSGTEAETHIRNTRDENLKDSPPPYNLPR